MGNQPSNESGASRGQDQSHIHAGGHHVNHSTNHYSSSTHPPQQQQYASQGSSGRPSSTHSSPPQYTPQYSPSSHSATGYQMGGATVRPSSSRHPNSNVPPTSSDASMGNNSMEISTHHPKGPTSPSSSSSNLHPSISSSEDDVVPTVFRWEHGGREVYITGTFNGWTRQIPMHRSGNDFTYIHNLKRGKHAFKFIVDDEWRFAPDQPTVADIEGRINNFIDVTDFKPYMGDKSFEQEKNAAYYARRHPVLADAAGSNSATVSAAALGKGYGHPMSSEDGSGMDRRGSHHGMYIDDPDGEVFTTDIPDLDEYTKDPPPLPPHLRHIILNKPPQLQDTAALPVPQHVALNHLYCTAIRDNMMVLGITQRYRTKFVTTVYYSPELTR